MKTIFYNLLASVVCLSAITSCQVDEIALEEKMYGDATFTFYAIGAENQTKTIRQDDGSVWWDTDESIKIFCNGVSGKFTSDNIEPSAAATFIGSFDSRVTMDDISSNGIVAMYPYQEDATYVNGTLTFTLPSEQVATKGTFSKGLFPCIALSKDTNLSFYNICSGIKFSVTNDDIRSVTFKTSEKEPIAGLVEVDYLFDNMPTVHVKKGVSEVTVYAPDNGYFEPGEFYYITILPPPAPTYYFWYGFTMIYNKDNISDSITISESVPLPRSKFGIIEGKDAGLLFIDYDKPIAFADQIIKEQCIAAFDTNGDGELSYEEAKAVTDLSKMSLTNKAFKSFDEFQYFTSVRGIPASYFKDTELESIILPKGLNNIDEYAFRGCVNLKSINIPEGVTSIGWLWGKVFENCTSLTSIVFPNSVNEFCGGLLSGCSNLKEVVLPKNINDIPSNTFNGCSSLTSITIPDSVTSIGPGAFCNCSGLIGITIPDSVTSIGDDAFEGCSSLTSILLPDAVTSIGSSAFEGCSGLSSINIPIGVSKIEDNTFRKCSSLSSIVLPDAVTSIGSFAFEGCSGLRSINIPVGVSKIENYAFSKCSSLSSIILPEAITSIGRSSFHKCSSLPSIILPETVTSIGAEAFYECSSLENINIPIGVSKIEDGTFYYCSSLTNIVLPETVTSIGSSAFEGCSSLRDINIPVGVSKIENYTFRKCSSLSSIVLPETVTSIGNSAFEGCDSLTSFILPETLISIGRSSFNSCYSLTSIILPETVTSIGNSAFCGCLTLESVYVKSMECPELCDGDSQFILNANDRKIYVPKESLGAYKATTGWSRYADSIVGYDYENDKVAE